MPDDDGFDPYLDRGDKNNWRPGQSVNIGGRAAGKSRQPRPTAFVNDGLREFARIYRGTGKKPDARAIDNLLELISGLGVLLWTSNHRYTYAAIFADGRWFITGKGDWYSKNVFDPEEFIDVLLHDLVTDIRIGLEFTQLYSPPPF